MRLHIHKALILALAGIAGCGSSKPKPESTPDAAAKDASQTTDLENVAIKFDVSRPPDIKMDKGPLPDTALDVFAADAYAGPQPDAFVPGDIELLLVNSGTTGKYNLADGTWKTFSFDTQAGHFYCVGLLDDGVDAFVGQTPSVSPADYLATTNYLRALNFTSWSGGKYYLAVLAKGAGASGAVQIADGGDLLELGENTVDLTDANGETVTVYNFSVAPGHGYSVSITGNAKQTVTLGLSPLADRSTTGEFAFPWSTKTSALPIENENIPYESAAKSNTRLYFIHVKVKEPVSLTIKIDMAS